MKTLDIPGGTAQFREKHEIRVRHKQAIEGAAIAAASALSKLPANREQLESTSMVALGLTRSEAQSIYDLESTLIVATLAEWTLPDPLPTEESIGELEPALYDALQSALPLLGELIGGGGVDFSPKPQEPGFDESPTVPSTASDSDLRADQE